MSTAPTRPERFWWLPVIAFIAVYLVSLLVVGVVVWYIVSPPAHVLSYVVPQTVNNPGHVTEPGGVVSVDETQCSKATEDLPTRASSSWRNNDTGKLTENQPTHDNTVSPGCTPHHFVNLVPVSLPPGMYHLEGVTTYVYNDHPASAAWHTEDFCVTDAQGSGC